MHGFMDDSVEMAATYLDKDNRSFSSVGTDAIPVPAFVKWLCRKNTLEIF